MGITPTIFRVFDYENYSGFQAYSFLKYCFVWISANVMYDRYDHKPDTTDVDSIPYNHTKSQALLISKQECSLNSWYRSNSIAIITNRYGSHDMYAREILLKMTLNTNKPIFILPVVSHI